MASGRLNSADADQLVQGGRVGDAAWARVRPLYEEQERERREREVREVEAARPRDEDEALRRIDEAIEALGRAGNLQADESYWAATEISAAAGNGLTLSLPACDHYLIWSELTDWYELRPDERPAAVDAMRRAAAEWLTAKGDAATHARYFEKWLPTRGGSS